MKRLVVLWAADVDPAVIRERFCTDTDAEYRWLSPFPGLAPGQAFIINADTWSVQEFPGPMRKPFADRWDELPTAPV